MSAEATIIFPHQLFERHPALDRSRRVYVVEAAHFFTRFRFNKQKLVFHKATLIEYELFLRELGYAVETIVLDEDPWERLKTDGIKKVHCGLLHDQAFEHDVMVNCKKRALEVAFYETPYFMTTAQDFKDYFFEKKTFYFTSFYKHQREKFNILMTESNRPVGGKLTFDSLNRLKLPASHPVPHEPKSSRRISVSKAQAWAAQYGEHPGSVDDLIYPVTFDDARAWLAEFFEKRFNGFGTYQDALLSEKSVLFHSLLSPLLNVGLLTPDYVVSEALEYAQKKAIPLNSLEGFIRQIIGWREYVYGVYISVGAMQEKSNYFNHTNKLPASFWTGTTQLEPIDNVIKRVLLTGYAHHIERLMLLGNFMLLCEIDPHEVYVWFMELFIDSYDWVMIPNVYGMSQYADGGLMTTKPYISGANYLKKMSNYPTGVWEKIYTDLYWRFVSLNYDKLSQIPRMRQTVFLGGRDPEIIKKHRRDADLFLTAFLV